MIDLGALSTMPLAALIDAALDTTDDCVFWLLLGIITGHAVDAGYATLVQQLGDYGHSDGHAMPEAKRLLRTLRSQYIN